MTTNSRPTTRTPVKRRVAVLAVILAALWALPPMSSAMMLNFRDTDIREVIESVAELTGKNFLIDPRVRGKVTLLANEEIPEEALYDVMLAILRMNGFRAVEGENFTRILPGNIAARFKPTFLEGEPAGDSERLVTTIIRIRHLNAASVIPMIKPLMTPEAQVLVHKDTNHLLITEINSNLDRVIRRVIKKIDVKTIGDFEIIDLDHATASDIVGLVQRASNKHLRHLAQVVADKQGNRIILTGPENVRLSLRALIAELDSETSSDASGRIKVIRLHYARAEDVESIVKGLLSSAEFIKILGGEGEYEEQKKTTAKKDDKKKDDKKDDKKDEKKDEKKDDKKKDTKKSSKRNYVIEVDKALNALIVGGPTKVIAAIESVVREIDVPRPQVLIEAIFADVSETKAFNLGARIGADAASVPGATIDAATARSDSFLAAAFDIFGEEGRGFVAGGQFNIGHSPIRILVSALRSDGDSRVLSTPSILTMNNEEAMIDVSDVLSINSGTVLSDGGSTTDIERQEFGTTLKVQPQITEGDAVRLDIEYKTEDVLDSPSVANRDPDSRKREIKTTVLVNDGDILVLGGLSNERATENEDRVPLLSKVPILGHLFRNRLSNRNKTTLMVFIRPTILRNANEGSRESRERYAELRFGQLMDAQGADTLLPDEDQMVLPELPLPGASEGRKVKRKKKIIKRKKRRSDGKS